MSVWDGEARRAATPDATDDASAQIDTVVVGGGQAGLAVGYHLARRAHDFVILEAGDEPGVAWRNRWDSLRLFTPAGFSHLPGMRFPGPGAALPSKDEMADYLSAYAVRFGLPVELGVRVDAVRRVDDEFLISAAGRRWRARNVVAATGPYAVARVPEFAPALDPTVTQLTAQSYRRPEQLPDGPALVVGAGNSGAEIALDLAPTRPVWLSGPDVLQVPRLGVAAYRLMRLLGRFGAKRAEARLGGAGSPLGGVRVRDLTEAGIRRVPRTVGARDGLPLLADQRTLDVVAVVWCAGSRPDYRWLDLPPADSTARPPQRDGIAESEPGLYFVGLPFQSTITSHLVGGVGHDARRVVDHLTRRPAAERRLHAPARSTRSY